MLSALLCAVITSAADTQPAASAQAPGQVVAHSSDGATKELRPLDDPQNPYRDEYGEWDRWIVEHYDPTITPESLRSADREVIQKQIQASIEHSMVAGWKQLTGYVDEQGFFIPVSKAYSGHDSRCADSIEKLVSRQRPPSEQPKHYIFYATGVIPSEINAGLERVQAIAWSKTDPHVPAWLGETPPLFSVFVPNSEIVCYGELGLAYSPDPRRMSYSSDEMPLGETWYRYSALGELLGRMVSVEQYPWDEWMQFYWPTMKADWEKAQRSGYAHSIHRVASYTVLCYDPDAMLDPRPTGEGSPLKIIAAFDYDGTPLAPDARIEQRDISVGRRINRDQVASMYKREVLAGLTDPTVVSPFAGLPNGPQATDPTPRPPRLLAQKGQDGGFVAVRAMDDPANPYRGQYDPWDAWIRDNLNQSNPGMTERFRKLEADKTAKINALEAEGKEVPKELLASPSLAEDPDDPWKRFHLYVDSQGFIIPCRLFWPRRLNEDAASDARAWPVIQYPDYYTLWAGGMMEPGMKAQYDTMEWGIKAPRFPRVPEWLGTQPVRQAWFMPNGEIVTEGLPGSWTRERALLPSTEQYKDAPYTLYRYSAAGELLASLPTSQFGAWEKLYFPERESLIEDAEARGLEADYSGGYLIIRKPNGGAIEAAYDFDGTPVDFSKPLTRAPFVLDYVDWPMIASAYKAQNE